MSERHWTWSRGCGVPMSTRLWRASIIVEREPRRRLHYLLVQIRLPFTGKVLEISKTAPGPLWTIWWWSDDEVRRRLAKWKAWS